MQATCERLACNMRATSTNPQFCTRRLLDRKHTLGRAKRARAEHTRGEHTREESWQRSTGEPLAPTAIQRSRGEPLAATTPAPQGRAPHSHDTSALGESPSQPRPQESPSPPRPQRSNAPTRQRREPLTATTLQRSIAPGESPSQRREPLTLSVGIERQLSTLAQRQGLSALCPDRLHSRCCSQNGSNPTGMRGRARGASKTIR